jgi:hypothetical protein
MIEDLHLHAHDVKPAANLTESIDIDLKHETADVKVTERF